MSNNELAVSDNEKGVKDTSKFIKDFLVLIKLRMGFLAAIIAVASYYMGTVETVSFLGMTHCFVGTYLVCAGAFALNMFMEKSTDELMQRTENRPLPKGRIEDKTAFGLGLFFSFVGVSYLWFFTNTLAATMGALALGSYVLIYTPMKKISTLNTIVGSVPGAMPTLIGWAAATNGIDLKAMILFMILFFWQVPHFLAIAWMYKDDYARAGLAMISTVDPNAKFTVRQTLLWSITYVATTLLPYVFNMAGFVYFVVAAVSGIFFLLLSIRWFIKGPDRQSAVYLFLATLFHSPIIYIAMVLDKV